jgi:hypothetical protein
MVERSVLLPTQRPALAPASVVAASHSLAPRNIVLSSLSDDQDSTSLVKGYSEPAIVNRKRLSMQSAKLLSQDNTEFCGVLDLAFSDELLVFVGAGCSIEAGLPDWKELAVRYINEAMRETDLPEDLPNRFGNPRHLAIIADAMVGEFKRFNALCSSLYPHQRPPSPGPTAKEIAKLYRARLRVGLKTFIVTTNFDPLLEMALDEHVTDRLLNETGEVQVVPAVSLGLEHRFPDPSKSTPTDNVTHTSQLFAPRGADDPHEPVVFHLHGAIDLRDSRTPKGIEPIILTERDYAMWEHLAQKALLELLDNRDCLMVGLGLEDNDVLTALYTKMKGRESMRVPLGGKRFVVAFNEIPHNDDEAVDHAIARQVRKLETKRLEKLGVSPLKNLKTFGQIPQVLHEMGYAIELSRTMDMNHLSSADYWNSGYSYGSRLNRWKRDFAAHYLADDQFAEQQDKACRACQEVLERIVNVIHDSIGKAIDDELAIHVWVRSQRDDRFEMFPWCSNEFARRGEVPGSLSKEIERADNDIARRQVFDGVPSRGLMPAAPHSRWAQVMAVPVISTTTDAQHEYGRLMVGVVTLSTNLKGDCSDLSESLKDNNDQLLEELQLYLEEVGHNLLINCLAATEA